MAKSLPAEIAARLRELSKEILDGPMPVKVNAVADATGISRSTLYYYFDGSDDLTRFFMEELLGRIGAAVETEVAAQPTPPRKLAAVINTTLSFTAAQPTLAAALLRAVFTDFGEHTYKDSETVFGHVRAIIEEGIADGSFIPVDSGDVMALVFGAVSMVSLHELGRAGADPEVYKNTVLTVVLRGVCVESDTLKEISAALATPAERARKSP
ncbi:MAG TPA: TetR/AcrR family transcriptional regulator [Pseudonocardia sp.]|jgi:AcrR family transcriptional regulator